MNFPGHGQSGKALFICSSKRYEWAGGQSVSIEASPVNKVPCLAPFICVKVVPPWVLFDMCDLVLRLLKIRRKCSPLNQTGLGWALIRVDRRQPDHVFIVDMLFDRAPEIRGQVDHG